MPEDLILPFEKTTVATENAGATLSELLIVAATPNRPGVIAVVLGPKDEDGNFRTDVEPRLVRKTDDPNSENPMQQMAASMFHELMFTAIISDTPTHQMLNVVGLTVWDAAKVILGQELGGAN